MKTIKLLTFLSFMFFVFSCNKKETIDKKNIRNIEFSQKQISDTILRNNLSANFNNVILSKITKPEAREMIDYYKDTYGDGKYEFFFMTKALYKMIKNNSNFRKDSINFVFTQNNNGKLNIHVKDKNNKYYDVEDFMTNEDSNGSNKKSNFLNGNIYKKWNQTISSSNNKYPKNSEEILAPMEDFSSLDVPNSKNAILLICGADKTDDGTKKKRKNAVTLVMVIGNLSLDFKELKDATTYYDTFCKIPPGC